MRTIKRSYEIEAAMLRLEPFLANVERGAELTFLWARERSGLANPKRLDHRLRRYFHRRGIRIKLRGDRWLVLDDRAQKSGVGERQSHVRREHVRSMHEIINVDRDKLNEVEKREADHYVRHINRALDLSHNLTKELRAIYRVADPNPRPRPEPPRTHRIRLGSGK